MYEDMLSSGFQTAVVMTFIGFGLSNFALSMIRDMMLLFMRIALKGEGCVLHAGGVGVEGNDQRRLSSCLDRNGNSGEYRVVGMIDINGLKGQWRQPGIKDGEGVPGLRLGRAS